MFFSKILRSWLSILLSFDWSLFGYTFYKGFFVIDFFLKIVFIFKSCVALPIFKGFELQSIRRLIFLSIKNVWIIYQRVRSSRGSFSAKKEKIKWKIHKNKVVLYMVESYNNRSCTRLIHKLSVSQSFELLVSID